MGQFLFDFFRIARLIGADKSLPLYINWHKFEFKKKTKNRHAFVFWSSIFFTRWVCPSFCNFLGSWWDCTWSIFPCMVLRDLDRHFFKFILSSRCSFADFFNTSFQCKKFIILLPFFFHHPFNYFGRASFVHNFWW